MLSSVVFVYALFAAVIAVGDEQSFTPTTITRTHVKANKSRSSWINFVCSLPLSHQHNMQIRAHKQINRHLFHTFRSHVDEVDAKLMESGERASICINNIKKTAQTLYTLFFLFASHANQMDFMFCVI